jgi:hypothetical protein
MAKQELTRSEKIALVKTMKNRYFSLQNKSFAEQNMEKALIAAVEVIEDFEGDSDRAYHKGYKEGRLFEAKQARLEREVKPAESEDG